MTILSDATEQSVKRSYLKTKKRHQTVYKLSSDIYGATVQFKINKAVEKLAQDYLEFYIETEATADGFNTMYLATRIMSNIIIRNESGTAILDHIRPEKIIYLLEKMKGNSGMYGVLNDMITPPNSFTETKNSSESRSCTLKIPLMFFYCFPWSEYLDIRETEQLIIECKVNNSLGMGMVKASGTLVNITKLHVSLYQEYYTKSKTYTNLYESHAHKQISRTIPKSFKSWYDETILLPAGSTSYQYLMHCDLPTNNIIAMIFEKSVMYKINSYTISLNGIYIVGDDLNSVSTDYDYNLTNQFVGNTEIKHVNYFFDQKSDNVIDSNDYITFSAESNMCPAFLTIYFDALPVDAHLYVFNDVPTKYTVSQDRSISSNKMTLPDNFISYSGKFTRSG